MKNVFNKGVALIALISLGMLTACNDDPIDFSSSDSNNVESETVAESYFEDVDDLATLAISADASTATGSRLASAGRGGVKPSDSRFNCATVTFEFAEDNSVSTPHGFIKIDFGAGCTDARGNVRKGVIMIEFRGIRFMPNAQIITTLEGYSINDIAIEGTRTVTNASASLEASPKFTITVEDGKITWPDGTFATREASRTREWVRALNPVNDEWIVTGSAAGSNRDGSTYIMEITTPLIYKRSCVSSSGGVTVKGAKVLTVDGKVITIDYGSGECDRMITITINGVTKEIEVKGKM